MACRAGAVPIALHALFLPSEPFCPGWHTLCHVSPFLAAELVPCHIRQGEVPLWSKILICDKYGLTYL